MMVCSCVADRNLSLPCNNGEYCAVVHEDNFGDNGGYSEVHVNEVSDNPLTPPGEQDDDDHVNKWPTNKTMLFLTLRETMNDEFNGPIRKNQVWERLATNISKRGCPASAKECRRKWHGLCRTYKKIKAHNKTFGSDRQTWPYYRQMNDILGDCPAIEPAVYTASNERIETTSRKDRSHTQTSQADSSLSRSFRRSSLCSLSSSKPLAMMPSTKRKKDVSLGETEKERRHQEKMQRIDIFNSLLERLDVSLCKTEKERYHQEKMQRVDTFNSLLERLVKCEEQKHHNT